VINLALQSTRIDEFITVCVDSSNSGAEVRLKFGTVFAEIMEQSDDFTG